MKFSQTIWEFYFVASLVFAVSLLFVGTLEGSSEITVYPYILIASIINVGVAVYIGLQPSEDTDNI